MKTALECARSMAPNEEQLDDVAKIIAARDAEWVERCAQVIKDARGECNDNELMRRIRALAAPPAGPDVTFEDGPQCQSCEHHEAQHTPECENCGCWGFFRKGASHCDNPRCEGTGCAGNRGTDHGPNDTSAPAGTGGRR